MFWVRGWRGALYLLLIAGVLLAVLGWYGYAFYLQRQPRFDGQRAYAEVQRQVAFGPRTPGSIAHAQFRAWLQEELLKAGWQVEVQEVEEAGHALFNLIARRDSQPPRVLLGAHYDSRLQADRDPDPSRRRQPVPGANDGASGVAILLELARALPQEATPIWLVFFDGEDQGNLPGWENWSLGARAFVRQLSVRPEAVVIVDMVGDAELDLPLEANSDPALREAIWKTAAELGYGEIFRPELGYAVIDDHIPFLESGVPAVNIIDLNYPFWHTTQDTPDKVSPRSLQVVGEVLLSWLTQRER